MTLFKNIKKLLLFLIPFSTGLYGESMKNLNKKVVVITGASQGIGFTTAKYLAEQGYIVCAGVRKTSSREDLEKLIQQYPSTVIIANLDVTDENMIATSTKTILDRFGRIDVLINNACEIIMGPMEIQTIEEQQRVMNVNYFGPVRMIQAIAPIMRQQESGNIINISSVSGFSASPHFESYAASKFALEGLSEAMATNLAPWNIKISLIEPGPVRTQSPLSWNLGTRQTQGTQCFADYNEKIYTFFKKRLTVQPNTPGFSEPIEIAQLIHNIITTDKPHLRYQVGPLAITMGEKRFKDVTGDSYIEDMKKLLKERRLTIRNS